jgi:cyclase
VLAKRVIACLDVRDGAVVKGINFEGLRDAGDPAALARRYNGDGIDEIAILDITATLEGRRALAATIESISEELFIPLMAGGGIRSESDAEAAIAAGADKVAVNTAALSNPALVTSLADRYGSQAVVVAIDARLRQGSGEASLRLRQGSGEASPTYQPSPRYDVFARAGRAAAGRDAVEWAREAVDRGAGEILLTSIDRDGTRAGFDCELTAAVSSAVAVPVIASGGAGTFAHFVEVFTAGRADAALAASVFHFEEHPVADL